MSNTFSRGQTETGGIYIYFFLSLVFHEHDSSPAPLCSRCFRNENFNDDFEIFTLPMTAPLCSQSLCRIFFSPWHLSAHCASCARKLVSPVYSFCAHETPIFGCRFIQSGNVVTITDAIQLSKRCTPFFGLGAVMMGSLGMAKRGQGISTRHP